MGNQKGISEKLVNRFKLERGLNGYEVSWVGDIANIEFKSPKGLLKAHVNSGGEEISVFFEDPDKRTDWHTHMSLFGANEVDEQIEKSIEWMKNLISGVESISQSSKYGLWIWDSEKLVDEYADEDEIVKIVKWADL
jgi:hypothetical protein